MYIYYGKYNNNNANKLDEKFALARPAGYVLPRGRGIKFLFLTQDN